MSRSGTTAAGENLSEDEPQVPAGYVLNQPAEKTTT